MEKDTINAHGASKFLRQKFYNDSDKFPIYICRNCEKPAIVNIKHKFLNCVRCEDNADIVKVNSSWVSKNLFHHFNSMGIDIKYGLNNYFSI